MATIHAKKKAAAGGELRVRTSLGLTTATGVESGFTVVPLEVDPTVARLAVRLIKADGEYYDIHQDTYGVLHCDCPDGTYHPERPGGCKHIRGLRAQIALFQPLAPLLKCRTGTAEQHIPQGAF